MYVDNVDVVDGITINALYRYNFGNSKIDNSNMEEKLYL